jgi:hypothetical protein
MTAFVNAIGALVHLFVDDGSFALEILGAVVLAAIIAALVPGDPSAAGAALLLGCLGVLAVSVIRAGRR